MKQLYKVWSFLPSKAWWGIEFEYIELCIQLFGNRSIIFIVYLQIIQMCKIFLTLHCLFRQLILLKIIEVYSIHLPFTKGGSRHKNWCMARVLSFLIRYFSNHYTLHRSDLAARAAPLDPRLIHLARFFGFARTRKLILMSYLLNVWEIVLYISWSFDLIESFRLNLRHMTFLDSYIMRIGHLYSPSV